MSIDSWHFARLDFTHDMFTLLHGGTQHAVRLFGTRRTGKTQFLLYDLAHRLSTYGNRFAYVNFWQVGHPLELLSYECDEALKPRSLREQAARLANRAQGSIGVSANLGGAEVSASGELNPLPTQTLENELLKLRQKLDRLNNPKQPSFLLLDEFQQIAKFPDGAALLENLRNLFDSHKQGIKTVFCGSSQDELRALFETKSKPGKPRPSFDGFGISVDLPPLPDTFVDYQCQVFHKQFGRHLDRDYALDFFTTVRRNPHIFVRWITQQQIRSDLEPQDAADKVLNDLAKDYGYVSYFRRVSAEVRVMARLLAERVDNPTGKTAPTRYKELTGKEPPSARTRARHLTQLRNAAFLDSENGKPFLSDPAFEQWVLRLEPSALSAKTFA